MMIKNDNSLDTSNLLDHVCLGNDERDHTRKKRGHMTMK